MDTKQTAEHHDNRTPEQRQRDIEDAAAFYEAAVMLEQFERRM